MPRMLSPHFALEEITVSETAARRGLDNTPDAAVLKNLKRLALALEEVRTALGDIPIVVSSGYRSPAVNKAIGGATKSAHMFGLAADFTAPSFGTVLQTAKAVAASGVDYDQIIYEFGRWVHMSLAAEGSTARRQTLSIKEKATYEPGLRNL